MIPWVTPSQVELHTARIFIQFQMHLYIYNYIGGCQSPVTVGKFGEICFFYFHEGKPITLSTITVFRQDATYIYIYNCPFVHMNMSF